MALIKCIVLFSYVFSWLSYAFSNDHVTILETELQNTAHFLMMARLSRRLCLT